MVTMHRNSWLRVLLLFGLCSTLLAAVVLPVSSDPDCPYEYLPDSLDTLSGLGFNGELNIHNEYYTPFVRGQNHAITFTLTQPSAFRIYIEPHYVDIDIWLYKDSTSIAHTSDYSLADEVVFKTLDPGNYRIRIYFFGTMTGSCPTMMTEISIVPLVSLTQRLSSYTCPPSQLLPSISPGTVDAVKGFNYDSASTGAIYNVQYTPSGSFAFLTSYTFTLPQVNQIGDTWEVEAVLGINFPTSALGLLLLPYNATISPTPVAPADLSCYDAGNCSIAAHNAKGQSTLKALVLPGTYILWLYDVPRDRNVSFTPCSPFTMSLRIAHAEQMEDFLNCAGEPFPKIISEAGILDDHGFMYYREDILVDLAVTQNTFQFTITEDSYFRAYTAAHRIDIDLKLINSSKTVAYGYQYGSTEEAIQSFISAGNYTFQLILFGKYNSVFCETALLEIAIAPKSLYTGFDVCTGKSASAPDISGLTKLSTTDTYILPYNTYRYVYTGVNSQNVPIVSQAFNITSDSYLQAQLGSNFLLGDIRFTLTSATVANGTSTSVQLGYHRRNMHFIDILLPKSQMNMSFTTYTLTIVTADTQGIGSGTGFPPCATYSLSMSIIPANKTGPQLCLSSRPFPSTLNTPQNLLTSPKIHIQEEFLVPKIDALYAKETVTWGNITTPSYFRFYVEPHHIDIDLKLEENGTTVAQGIAFNLEEVIVWVLKPNTNYVLTITYYKWYFVDHGKDPCYTYQAELAITPVTETSVATNCTSTKLPVDLGTVVADSPVYIEDDFQFTQDVDPRDIKVKFTLTATSLFRASVTYDFVWNDLALRLDLPGSSDPVQGDLDYNRNEISLIQLVAGNYTLHIYEPFNTTSSKTFNLRNCVEFHLTLGVEVIVNTKVDTLLMSCPDQYFPAVWNSPGLLSNLSGNIVDFNRYVLADVTDKTDSFTFTLYTQSVFRLYLPVDALLDVDVTLYKGTSSVASQVSYGKEESIVMTLAPANYTVKFTYYGLAQTSVLPPPSACAAFRIEISIWPVAALQAVSNITSSCTSNFFASALIDPTVTNNKFNFQRSLETQIYFYAYTMFTVKTTSLFTVRFEQNDVSGGIAMLLQAANISKTYQPLYFQNHIYLNEYLLSGTYNLSFHDPVGKSSLSLQCAPYSLYYSLVAAEIPAGACDADVLPSDLNTTAGGSTNYGGPQAADGSIHFFGDNFAMAKGTKNKDNYILISAKTKSYLRIFLALEPGNTITANLFRSPNLTSSAPIASTVAAGSIDRSNVWMLPAQSDYYVLDLYYTTVSSSSDCSYFTFELVLEPETAVLAGLACPAKPLDYNKQMPPETITTYQGQDYNISSGFYITSDRYSLNIHDNVYTYTMTLNVASNSTLSAIVSYDFVVNEFLLMLRDTNGNNITTGIHQESAATDSGNNFMNYLQWNLAPGTYRLVLADVGARTFNLSTFCHYFSFSMTLSTTGAGGLPRILQVLPSSGDNLNPNAALTISVTFSEPATTTLPAGYSLSAYLAEQKIVYLQAAGNGGTVTPIDAFFDMSNTVLQLRFVGFADGQSYSLVVSYAKFVTRNNTAFTAGAMSFGHNYVMHKCSGCSGHGACVPSGDNSWVCACVANWTGSNCDRCADGYHGAGVTCVPNTYCNTNSCNSHGSCSDAAGYPVCSCRYGYTGPACDTCAPGYTGYPNCTMNSTDTDEDVACTAPMLPMDLNTPAFLGYTGRVHLQGWYYINQDARQHETRFTLTTRSVFRVYTEPFEIDIDLWLYRVNADGTLTMVTFRITFGLEETIYTQLNPGNYLLRFRYYMWVSPSTDCATFNLEWAISPLTSVLEETAQSKAFCGGLPNIAPLTVSSPYSYSQTSFSVSAPTSTAISTDANYFYRLNITITPPANKVANLRATIGYRFLPGDISILLEAGRKGDHCGNTGTVFSITPPSGCTYGDNLQNVNTLHTFVEPGDYILWIYEPIKQIANISTCSPFDFSLDIEFVDDEQDIFSCDMPLIPLSLESSQYQERPGYIHFRDNFVLDVDRTMGFNVTQSSLVRVAITGEDIGVVLYDAKTGKPVSTNGDSQSISATLNVGSYYLKFTGDMFWFCPVLPIEFAIAPVANGITVTCPAGSGNPPPISISAIPFDYGPSRARPSVDDYYTANLPNTPVVAAYPFRLTANGFIDAGVESDFLRGNLHLELYRTDRSTLVTAGDFNYNHNLIQEVLEPGSYELRIVLPPGPRVPELPGCIKYNFEMHISYTTSNSPGCETNNLPFTLNTMHFLGYEGTMNFQAENWRIPSLSFATFHNINFSVPQPSLIHIYTEPHTVDIDIKILAATGGVLASGSNAIGTEESLTYMLNASTTYIFQLQFYNFFGSGFSIPPCESFNMEIEIGPIPVRPAICPNQGSSWPQISGALTLPYSYNSIDNDIDLFVQQVSRKAVSYNTTITLPAAANVHAEVGYDFLVGDLVIKLYSVSTKEVFLGSNKQDRNIINLINIPKGQYVLTIYEPTYNLDSVLACSPFTFAFYAQQYSALISEDRFLIEYYLPGSLDTISYLLASKKTHLSGNFYMFDGTGAHESTSFTVTEASILRVDCLMFESEIASTHHNAPGVTLYSGQTLVSSSNGSLLATVQSGKYTVKFTPPSSFTEQGDMGVPVTVQLALDTTSNLQAELNSAPVPQDCTSTAFNTIQISPDGAYQDGSTSAYVAYSQLTTNTDIARLPFTVDRYSVVYLQVGSQFLLSELEARVTSANSSLVWRGRMKKNINEVHQILPAGDYVASIRQPIVQTSTSSLPHCGIFSYSLIVADAGGLVDFCTSLQALPWQLDTTSGGSAPYGGPIASDGTLHLYGDNMHVPAQTNSFINFTITQPSFMSVLVVGYPASFTGIDFTMLSNTGSSQTPTQTVSSSVDRSRITLYNLQTSPYQLGIGYRRGSSVAGICYSYTLQIDITPVATVQNQVTCSTSTTGAPLPAVLAVDPTTNYVSGTITSFFQGWGSVTGLSQSITFTTKTTTSVIISLSYNSLVTAFSMKLYNAKNSLVSTAQTRGQATKSGQTNVYLYLGSNVPAGNYTINITHPTTDSPFLPAAQVCAPFVFTYQIGIPAKSKVEITNVSPPNVNGLDPTENLQVTITFSGTIYATGNTTVASANSSVVTNAFYLTGSDNSVLRPIKAEAADTKAMRWQITFPTVGITSVVEYTLSLGTNQLFDVVGSPILLSSLYKYTTVNCGIHGSLKSGKCVCALGYAGTICDTCDTALGYVQPSGTQICVLDQCTPRSCGCVDSSCLAKIGTCSTNSSGLAHCYCPALYQGEHCEACKDGYTNYPTCIAACDPQCVHGACDAGKCQCLGNWDGKACNMCPSNFAGDNCDKCADGYSGANCDTYKSGGSDWGATKTFLEVTGVLVIIALAAAGAFWYWRYRRAGSRYHTLVSRFDMDDDDEDGHHFAHSDNRLVDDEDIPPIIHEHEDDEHEEPRVELPSGGGINSEAPEGPVSGSNNPPRLLDM